MKKLHQACVYSIYYIIYHKYLEQILKIESKLYTKSIEVSPSQEENCFKISVKKFSLGRNRTSIPGFKVPYDNHYTTRDFRKNAQTNEHTNKILS